MATTKVKKPSKAEIKAALKLFTPATKDKPKDEKQHGQPQG